MNRLLALFFKDRGDLRMPPPLHLRRRRCCPPHPGEEYAAPKMIANLSDNDPKGLLNVSRACLDFLKVGQRAVTMEMPTVMTTQLIIDHFKEDSAWHRKWLLVFERNITTFEKKVKRVWDVIGSEGNPAVLAAIKCWTSTRAKPQGLVMNSKEAAAGIRRRLKR